MHRVIYMAVRADDVPEAVERAESAFERYLQYAGEDRLDGSRYDYCKPMTSGHTVAGSDRWSGFRGKPPAAALDTEQGREYLDEARRYTYQKPLVNCLRAFITLRDDGLGPLLAALVEASEEADHGSAWEVIEDLEDRYPADIGAFGDSFARHYFSGIVQHDPMECFLFDDRPYADDLSLVDSPAGFERFEERDVPYGETHIVPLDVHH